MEPFRQSMFFLLVISACVIQLTEGQGAAVVRRNVAMGPTVSIKDGKVRPKLMQSRFERQYYGFLGIPYAAPPNYNMRYQPPSVPMPWSDTLNATEYGPKCIQYDSRAKKVVGDEDCLYLNIFTPKLKIEDTDTPTKNRNSEDYFYNPADETSKYYPVIVFIHGGYFMTGSASTYDASYFMDEDVVIVTLNYRLGSFGFLNTGDDSVPGNLGLKDQVMVLKWIQENIETFYGNRNSVTLVGQNAGAASVHYHMLSPMSKGLFDKGISMSGTALCPWAYTRNPKSQLRQLGTLLNCPTTDIIELVDCLKIKDAQEIAEQHKNFVEWNVDPIAPFSPSMEHSLNEIDVFLNESPYKLIQKQSTQSQVPWIVGVVEDEGLFSSSQVLTNRMLSGEINQDWNRVAPLAFFYRDNALERDTISDQVRTFYFGYNDIGNKTTQNLTNLYSDRYFCHCNRVAALLHMKHNEGNKIYLYYFTQRSSRSSINSLGIHHHYGVSNGDELQYLFRTPVFPAIGKTNKYTDFSKRFIKLWLSFANSGVPTATWESTDLWNPIQSEEVKGEVSLSYLRIGKNITVIDEPFSQRMAFWDRLPLNEFEDDELSVFGRKAYRS